jgi:signal transduction histidine kinase
LTAWLAGFFACAAIHYAIHWWLSRKERVLLVFCLQCVAYSAFCVAMAGYFRAKTIADVQATLDRFVTIGVLAHGVALHFYAELGGRRDRAVRLLLTGWLVALALLNQWVPVRGVVLELQTVQLPGGATSVLPIRTPPGATLVLLYVAVVLVHCYGLFVVQLIWRRDRSGSLLLALGSAAILSSAVLALLVDFAHLRAPFPGAWPHALFVLCATLFLSREYSARGRRLAASETELRAHRERLEELVAQRTLELSAAKEDAERASRAKSLFLAHMSHEIRNPLHAMLAYTQSLERDPALGRAQRNKLDVVSSSGKHLQTLISDVLEMSKIEAGRPELVEGRFDPWATLVEVERMFSGEAAAKGIQLAIERASELPRALLGDGPKVKQTLINLASNALKFTKQGSVRVQASSRELAEGLVQVEIVVADTGVGIAAQDLARMFQPFEQLDAGKRAGGSGLGLAISLAHARLMSGDLRVESTPGAGSSFSFSYVAKRVEPEAPAMLEPNGASGATRRKVLVVDDVAINREILADLLTETGFETRTAAAGAVALDIHADWCPDLVLLDLRMPGMDGLEAIQRLRAAGSRALIGALTASTLEQDERDALDFGADFFLRKPFEDQELLDRVGSLLTGVPG